MHEHCTDLTPRQAAGMDSRQRLQLLQDLVQQRHAAAAHLLAGPVLTASEVAGLWQVGEPTARHWHTRGLLPAFRKGGRLYFALEVVLATGGASQARQWPVLLATQEVAALTGWSADMVRGCVRTGALAALNSPGGQRRYPAWTVHPLLAGSGAGRAQ